jgi:hypothetical protein
LARAERTSVPRKNSPSDHASACIRWARPLQKIAQKDSHAWLETNFVPWLAARLKITEASLYTFKACISELFNNIQDHTQL